MSIKLDYQEREGGKSGRIEYLAEYEHAWSNYELVGGICSNLAPDDDWNKSVVEAFKVLKEWSFRLECFSKIEPE